MKALMKPHSYSVITVIVFISIGLALVGVPYVITQQQDMSANASEMDLDKSLGAYSKNLPPKHPSPSPLSMYGETITLEMTEKTTGMDIERPTFVPNDLELKMIKVRAESGGPSMWTFIYAPITTTLTEESTAENVLDNNGVFVINTKMPKGFDVAKHIKEYGENTVGAQFIKIKGHKAIGFNGEPTQGKKSQIIFADKDIQIIVLSVGYNQPILQQIAESIQKEKNQ